MAVADVVACGVCGKKLAFDAAKTERNVRCPACGNVTLIRPPQTQTVEEPSDEYDLADEPAPPTPPVGGSPVTAKEVLEHLGHAHVTRKRIEPDAKEVAAQRMMESLAEPDPVRELVIPAVLICVGLVLSYCELMVFTKRPIGSPAEAMMTVLGKAVLSMGLSVGGIFLATTVFDVCIVGSFQRAILRICAIGIAPSALYGILCYMAGDLNGSLVGVFASVLAYGLLYYFLLRLDLKDTSVCVLVTWILITAINYAAYRVQGAKTGSAI